MPSLPFRLRFLSSQAPAMGNDTKFQSRPTMCADKAQKQVNVIEKERDLRPAQRPSFLARTSLESTTTTLPCYTEQPDRPPRYENAAVHSIQSNAAGNLKPTATLKSSPGPSGPNAAAVRAMMATSSSSTDKMHSQRSRRVDEWNKDPTYKGKLASMVGSTRKLNYFGADVEQYGNPFKRSGKKK